MWSWKFDVICSCKNENNYFRTKDVLLRGLDIGKASQFLILTIYFGLVEYLQYQTQKETS